MLTPAPQPALMFLSGLEIVREIRFALSAAETADIAVAHWGFGAAESLGIDKIRGPVRLICDAFQ